MDLTVPSSPPSAMSPPPVASARGSASAEATGGLLDALQEAKRDQARGEGLAIASAIELWQATRDADRCPTIGELVRDRVLSPSQPPQDPWGHPYAIACDAAGPAVRSNGPDGQAATPDDVVASTR